MARATTLTIEHFGPITRAHIPLADITVLVGPQATGKSLALQWLKLAVDHSRILGTLSRHGFEVDGDPERLLGWMFGASYRHSVTSRTKVAFRGQPVSAERYARGRKRHEAHRVLYVPAHRALVFGRGFPLGFRSFDDETPFVVKDFSERVRDFLANRSRGDVFPAKRRFRQSLRAKLDDAIFHGGRVHVASKGLAGKELRLVHGREEFGIMEWTTGQREVLPLVVGLFDALPAGNQTRRDPIRWIIVEEPELGLHPNAVMAVVLLLLETVRRGYRLVLSTHTSLVLDVLWAVQMLQGRKDGMRRFLRLFDLPANPYTRELASTTLASQQSIVHLDFAEGGVKSTTITDLDPLSDDRAESGWGGLIAHASRIAEVVSGAE